MTWFVHVNRGQIDSNRKHGTDEPVLTIKRGKRGKPTLARRIRLPEGSEMIYDPVNPILPCGARCVVMCPSEPEVVA